ncbi:hypothetical protein L9F63_023176 [Diploptera punctata]|uniref:Uncharacterized protein n=1 Tax=Diploptera punctata TaxID=6984 RepID=A0AAD7ZJ64_DIPPU|nr:hypothetical protein L9F63_023176 [Diploptera punctata]
MTPDFMDRPNVDEILNHPCFLNSVNKYKLVSCTNSLMLHGISLAVTTFKIQHLVKIVMLSPMNILVNIRGISLNVTACILDSCSISSKKFQMEKRCETVDSFPRNIVDEDVLNRTSSSLDISSIDGDISSVINNLVPDVCVINSTPNSAECYIPRKRSSPDNGSGTPLSSKNKKRFCAGRISAQDCNHQTQAEDDMKHRRRLRPISRNLLSVLND